MRMIWIRQQDCFHDTMGKGNFIQCGGLRGLGMPDICLCKSIFCF